MAQSFACGETLARRGGVSTRHRTRRSVGGRDNQTAASTATHLTPFASRVAGLVGGPLVGGAFLVSRASALAGDLTLLLGGHRRESSPFLAFSCIHYWASVFLCARHRARSRTTYGPFWSGWGGGSWTRGGRGSSRGVSGASSVSLSRS